MSILLWAGALATQSTGAAGTYIGGSTSSYILQPPQGMGSLPHHRDAMFKALWGHIHTQSFSTSTEDAWIPRVVHGSPQTFVLMEGESGLAVGLTVARHPAKPC